MNLWVRLPEPLDAGELLPRAQREGVSYLARPVFRRVAGRSRRVCGSVLRSLPPEKIREGLAILGRVFGDELERLRESPGDWRGAGLGLREERTE